MDFDLTLTSPAKLNLFLHINGRRADGYHELQTLFQLLDVGDRMHFRMRRDGLIRLTPEIPGVVMEQNLAYRAARLLQAHANTSLGVEIDLHKRLPMGGGLGGGSSNAATTLLALNQLWSLNLPNITLQKIGLQLGADVPVFVAGKSAFAEGVGEQLSPMNLQENYFLVIKPNCHVSTAEIFSHQRLTRDTPKIKIAPALEGLGSEELFKHTRNDCEDVATALYPEIREAINWLNQFGHGRLTGTGACCFCRFENKVQAQRALTEAQSKFEGFIARGVNFSPAIERLNEAG
ncbi:MAG: 4-(cytidine 5'-diphospho)-2-C-methyl-D-erythritol kinase [Oleiphilus sp.]|nr:MAG: 4-(cytidine 5'-diphospho)-2-C-methyl-D-erythritol kinase [Oleiphilus sp.]